MIEGYEIACRIKTMIINYCVYLDRHTGKCNFIKKNFVFMKYRIYCTDLYHEIEKCQHRKKPCNKQDKNE